MISKLEKLEKLINSELSSKIQNSSISNDEILIEVKENYIIDVIQFLKSNEDCKFSYRKCHLPKDLIFLKAFLRVKKGDQKEISKKIADFNKQREETQPIKAKTGGSSFKNPPNMKAWQLIDQAGCRGKRIGDAQMSEKHCNFMINHGSNNADDLIKLGEYVIDQVLEKTGVKLEWEVRIIE